MTPNDIKETQDALGWTNSKLAERMRVSLSTVEKWRAGSVRMGGPEAALFASITGPLLRAARKAAERGLY
jgi:DNA-binding transcriptional regulator YiaG